MIAAHPPPCPRGMCFFERISHPQIRHCCAFLFANNNLKCYTYTPCPSYTAKGVTLSMHTHYYEGMTSYNDGHSHYYSGTTSPSEDFPGHTHTMAGYTTVDDGHNHQYSLVTSAPVMVGPGHVHQYSGPTAYADNHNHMMHSFTFVSQ